MLKECKCRSGDHNIINVQEDVRELISMAVDEQRDVRFRRNKTEAMSVESEPLVPCTGRLFEPIERLVKAAHRVGATGINKTRRLLAMRWRRKSNDARGLDGRSGEEEKGNIVSSKTTW